jgi:inner membrane protein
MVRESCFERSVQAVSTTKNRIFAQGMDSLTHIVLGAVSGDLVAGRKLGKKAMLWGALVNSLPDIDVGCSLWMREPDSLLAHRGFTHSLPFAVLAAVALAFLLRRRSGAVLSFAGWTGFFLLQLVLHDAVDVLTVYGTGLLEPFSHARYALNVLFVADPFFTLPLLAGFVALLVLKSHDSRRTRWSVVSLLLPLLYIGLAAGCKTRTDGYVSRHLPGEAAPGQVLSTPTPFNIFLWYILVGGDQTVSAAHVSVFDKEAPPHWESFDRGQALLEGRENDHDVRQLIRFSEGFYCVRVDDGDTCFHDMRFGQVGGWYAAEAPFVFRYDLERPDERQAVIQGGRLKASTGEAMRKLYQRIVRDIR